MTPLKYEYVLDYNLMKNAYTLAGRLYNEDLKRSVLMRFLSQGLGLVLVAAMLVVWIFFVVRNQSTAGISVIGLLFLFIVLSYLYRSQTIVHMSRQSLIRDRHVLLEVDEAGIQTTRNRNIEYYPWDEIKEVREQAGWIAIVMKGMVRVLAVPDHAFPTAESREGLVSVLRNKGIAYQQSNLGTQDSEVSDVPVMTTGLHGLLRDFVALGNMVLFRTPRPDALIPSISKLIVFFFLYAGLILLIQIVEAGWEGEGSLSRYAISQLLAPFAALAIFAGIVSIAGKCRKQWGRITTGFFLLLLISPFSSLWVGTYSNTVQAFFIEKLGGQARFWLLLHMLPMMWLVIVAAVFVRRLAVRCRLPVALLAAFLVYLVLNMYGRLPVLWYTSSDEDAYPDVEVTEKVLYDQLPLLETKLKEIQAGREGVSELYFLGVGGEGYQNVFLNEVRSVAQLFTENYRTEGRALILVNNPETLDTVPLANPESLKRALTRFGEQMNPDEDVLFLFLTSHGSKDHRFSFDFWPFSFDDLTPEMLRQAMDEAGITRRVVVISACYSGGFIPGLQDKNTLVITAAAADRNSFGCADNNPFTDFGQAYFNEALRETRSFTEAFDIARSRIAEREQARGLKPSLPQMEGGEGVLPLLETIIGSFPDPVPHHRVQQD